jgi:hypothetical protein
MTCTDTVPRDWLQDTCTLNHHFAMYKVNNRDNPMYRREKPLRTVKYCNAAGENH